jgi:hypothetical protein
MDAYGIDLHIRGTDSPLRRALDKYQEDIAALSNGTRGETTSLDEARWLRDVVKALKSFEVVGDDRIETSPRYLLLGRGQNINAQYSFSHWRGPYAHVPVMSETSPKRRQVLYASAALYGFVNSVFDTEVTSNGTLSLRVSSLDMFHAAGIFTSLKLTYFKTEEQYSQAVYIVPADQAEATMDLLETSYAITTNSTDSH